ncbi:hypothetical protein [Levilactobacillus yonginensis]|uniref:hypothetical protein n=1 Tax=Levilactobacillus yonginensis TaxID=1054041 RepID=UPI00345D168A
MVLRYCQKVMGLVVGWLLVGCVEEQVARLRLAGTALWGEPGSLRAVSQAP